MANVGEDFLGPTRTPLIKTRVMAERKRLRVGKWPLGQVAKVAKVAK